MKKLWSFAFLCAASVYAQTTPLAPRKPLITNKPVCSAGAICFSGEVSAGKGFHKDLNDELTFDLQPEPDSRSFPVGEWTFDISPRQPENDCAKFASVMATPLRGHNDLEIDTSYGMTSENEVSWSPRKFNFVTNCEDYRTESKRLEKVLWPYSWTEEEANKALADLGTSPHGTGRLWITDSRISHANDTPDDKIGSIEWMRFTVEIRLPHQQKRESAPKARAGGAGLTIHK
jgi:hypothetical protein